MSTWIIVGVLAVGFAAPCLWLVSRKVGWGKALMLAAIPAAALAVGLLFMPDPGQPRERFFTVKMRQFAYDPPILRVNKGDTVHLTLYSQDVEHGFYLDGYGLDIKVKAGGERKNVTFTADKPGKFNFRCSNTCGVFHPFMIGKLIVEPNYTFPASLGLAVGLLLATFGYIFLREKAHGSQSAV